MAQINFKKEVSGDVESVIAKLTPALAAQGFGVLTRIDFHTKMKEKLGKDLPQTVILGACNPQLAFDAFTISSDVTALIPCNAVVRDLGNQRVSIELALPSAILSILENSKVEEMALKADKRFVSALEHL